MTEGLRGSETYRPAFDGDGLAERVDSTIGIREVGLFFGSGPDRMFGYRHEPLGRPRGGVVICRPFQAEALKNYRREVLLARTLAQRGFAVQRFDYLGAGNSDGDESDVTYDSMVEDARSTVHLLKESCGLGSVALVGARLGGLVAAAVARDLDGAPLVLWEPVAATRGYFREVLRARLIRELKDGVTPPSSREALLEELRRDGSVDVLGFSLEFPLYESVTEVERSLEAELGTRPRPVLLVQLRRSKELRSAYADLVASWTERGFPVAVHALPEEEAWWFESDVFQTEERRPLTRSLVDVTADWIEEHLPATWTSS